MREGPPSYLMILWFNLMIVRSSHVRDKECLHFKVFFNITGWCCEVDLPLILLGIITTIVGFVLVRRGTGWSTVWKSPEEALKFRQSLTNFLFLLWHSTEAVAFFPPRPLPYFPCLLSCLVTSHLLRDSLCIALQTEKLWIWSTGLSTQLTPSSRREAKISTYSEPW